MEQVIDLESALYSDRSPFLRGCSNVFLPSNDGAEVVSSFFTKK